MAALALCLLVCLAMTGYSSAAYCVCNAGLSDAVLQKNIDYACGNGADCTQILQNGPCFNPNTVRDHCNFAVNSYYQRKSEAPGTCDFSSTATVSQTPPNGQTSGCYPSSPSSGGTTPSIITPPTTPSITPGNNTPNTGTNTGTNTPSLTPGINNTPFGLGPATTNGINDNSDSTSLHQTANFFYSSTLTLFFSGLMWLRMF